MAFSASGTGLDRSKVKDAIAGKDIPQLLHDIISIGTPYKKEQNVINFLVPHMKKLGRVLLKDEFGNCYLTIGKRTDITTAFSCHMDTVHSKEEGLRLFLTINQDKQDNNGMLCAASYSLDKNKQKTLYQSVLGADDKAGVWIMTELIRAAVPGLYVFHVGEEKGGLGSRYIASKAPGLLKGIQRIIAFDRMGYSDVIGHQQGGRCCSLEFGKALADQITNNISTRIPFIHDARGTFTDTANYTKLIPECTNISVGYFNQHTDDEYLDVYWLTEILMPALLKVDWDVLPTVRDPAAVPVYNQRYGYGAGQPINTQNRYSTLFPSAPRSIDECVTNAITKKQVSSDGHIWGIAAEITDLFRGMQPIDYFAIAREIAEIIQDRMRTDPPYKNKYTALLNAPVSSAPDTRQESDRLDDLYEQPPSTMTARDHISNIVSAFEKIPTLIDKLPFAAYVKAWHTTYKLSVDTDASLINDCLFNMVMASADVPKGIRTKRFRKAILRAADYVALNATEPGFIEHAQAPTETTSTNLAAVH